VKGERAAQEQADAPVRAPIADFQDTMISERPAAPTQPEKLERKDRESLIHEQMKVDGKDSALADAFLLPDGTNCPMPFTDALSIASKTERFVIVNLVQKEDFSSLVLNRDVWKDEIIADMLQSSFLLWQRDNDSHEAKVFTEMYKVSEFPYIGVVHPNTKACIKVFNGKKWTSSETALDQLSSFLDSHSLAGPIS
jgi:hypothetical protein